MTDLVDEVEFLPHQIEDRGRASGSVSTRFAQDRAPLP
jgi:hypothetical protein